jgi:xylulokinase
VVASGASEHALFASPQPGWAEQDPSDWWKASKLAIRQALARSDLHGSDIECIGLTGQMHGAVLLDGTGAVIRPALIWCDQRSSAQSEELARSIGKDRILQLTANPPLANFTLTKLMWVREKEPDNWERVRHILLPKDYVRYRLTGIHATDLTDASGTLLLDIPSRAWSREVLSRTEIDRQLLPLLHESPEISARVCSTGAEETGLREGTPVVAGAGDQAAGAVGMGIVEPGRVSVTIGTSGVVFAATDRPTLDPQGRLHTFCHAVPGRWHVMGVTQAAGLSLRWFRDRFGAGPEDDRDPYERLTAEAKSVAPGADGLFWLPYLMGERTPHCDPDARAALVGLTASHTRAHIVRAILEGVAFSLKDSFSVFGELGIPIDSIRLGGGGARSELWRQIQADVYGQEVETVETEECAALGAAILAGVGAGHWGTVEEACAHAIRIQEKISPNPNVTALMARKYPAYRRIYPALRDALGPSR